MTFEELCAERKRNMETNIQGLTVNIIGGEVWLCFESQGMAASINLMNIAEKKPPGIIREAICGWCQEVIDYERNPNL